MTIKNIIDNDTKFDLVELKTTNSLIKTPHCKIHGAMNKVSKFKDSNGGFWRCNTANGIVCRAGAMEVIPEVTDLEKENLISYLYKKSSDKHNTTRTLFLQELNDKNFYVYIHGDEGTYYCKSLSEGKKILDIKYKNITKITLLSKTNNILDGEQITLRELEILTN